MNDDDEILVAVWVMAVVAIFTLCAPCPAEDLQANAAAAIAITDAPQGKPITKLQAKVKKKIELWSAPGCRACEIMKADIKAGLWDDYEVTVRSYERDNPPSNMVWVPAMRWERDGRRVIFPHDKSDESQAVYDRKAWQEMLR